MAGKVTDGQYINEGFVERMNNALWEHLPPEVQDEFWWPLQWDPAHWLDKVFDKFMDSEFVSRLLMRTKLFHTLFSYGKMHSVAKATAEEHDLPFRTTISFAKQSFLARATNNLFDSKTASLPMSKHTEIMTTKRLTSTNFSWTGFCF